MRAAIRFATLIWLAVSAPLMAQNSPVVVELYTSQGCSSCPPADEILKRLTERDDVLPLALHVDYWDYIGWKDKFADPKHAKRQKAYAHVGGRKMIYTPQMIIMGQDDVVGADAMQVTDLIAEHQKAGQRVQVSLHRDGNRMAVELTLTDRPVRGPLSVQLVQYSPLRQVDITRGELAGHQLSYANVVESWAEVAVWDGQGPLDLEATLSHDLPAAILVQSAGHGPILAAARAE